MSRASFLANFLRDPGGTGALAPATRTLSAAVARVTREARQAHGAGLPLIELGAGTGALTQGLRRMNPVLVERHGEWAELLRARFPALEVRNECAADTLRGLREPVGLVTSIPLLNNPQSAELKALLDEAYAARRLRFCVLYTYGWGDPLAGSGFREHRRAAFVPRSLPPAHVWLYR
jgi:phosphatidylethanolamine/phosphatidyl-N-methylethanolamine N-methyltransferase